VEKVEGDLTQPVLRDSQGDDRKGVSMCLGVSGRLRDRCRERTI